MPPSKKCKYNAYRLSLSAKSATGNALIKAALLAAITDFATSSTPLGSSSVPSKELPVPTVGILEPGEVVRGVSAVSAAVRALNDHKQPEKEETTAPSAKVIGNKKSRN
ncbi:uncharacterized protein PHACADRAFT_196292 [Phanerochaete carnosa HHB-10118-sp]|uniref:Uncharacterized protein n=1 Tax=Phanerochaete carnosa (strain HHB-10118-sp) TaxID=650164 RepID=K5UV43_PHACS|nr:uncharacterized protein PHACADRAFT_196292 [Phanerochaete carnosa HHB-10118-sp]EKM53851.1 hypothetical protein PHACADRAFT_196292 [Phanerochaete carnosa HHB-10118-sp]